MTFFILFPRNTSGAFLLQCWNLHHLHCTLIKWGQLCPNTPSVNSHPSSGKEFLTIAAMGPANLPGPLCRRSTDNGAFTRGMSEMRGKKKGYLLSCLRSCIKPTPAKDSYALMLAFVLCHFALIWEVLAFSWHGVCRRCCVSCSVNTVRKFWLTCWVWIHSLVGTLPSLLLRQFVMVMWDHLMLPVLVCHTDRVFEQPFGFCPSCSLKNIASFDSL